MVVFACDVFGGDLDWCLGRVVWRLNFVFRFVGCFSFCGWLSWFGLGLFVGCLCWDLISWVYFSCCLLFDLFVLVFGWLILVVY